MTPYKKIFVVGCPRSGTDWISKLIGQHSLVLSCGTESQAYPVLYEPFQSHQRMRFIRRLKELRRTVAYGGWRSLFFGYSDAMIWRNILAEYDRNKESLVGLHHLVSKTELGAIVDRVKGLQSEVDNLGQVQAAITEVFDTYWHNHRNTETVFVEKTPLHIRYVHNILSSYPEAKIVDVIRDGRDVDVSRTALARNPSKRWAQGTTSQKIDLLIDCIQRGNTYLKDPLLASRIYRIRFEDMRTDPNKSLADLFDFCELETRLEDREAILSSQDITSVQGRGDGHYVRKGTIGEW